MDSDPLDKVLALIDASKAILKRHDEKQPLFGIYSIKGWMQLRDAVTGWESNVQPVQRLLGAARCIWEQHLHGGGLFKDEGWINLRDAIAHVEANVRIFLKREVQ